MDSISCVCSVCFHVFCVCLLLAARSRVHGRTTSRTTTIPPCCAGHDAPRFFRFPTLPDCAPTHRRPTPLLPWRVTVTHSRNRPLGRFQRGEGFTNPPPRKYIGLQDLTVCVFFFDPPGIRAPPWPRAVGFGLPPLAARESDRELGAGGAGTGVRRAAALQSLGQVEHPVRADAGRPTLRRVSMSVCRASKACAGTGASRWV